MRLVLVTKTPVEQRDGKREKECEKENKKRTEMRSAKSGAKFRRCERFFGDDFYESSS